MLFKSEKGPKNTLTAYMKKKYANRPDKDNLCGVGVTDREFVNFIIDYLLGEDWCVGDPIGKEQINEIALYQILERYSKVYRNETKSKGRSCER